MMLESHCARRLRQLLFILIFVLTFEGVARKAAPPGFNIPLFLFKDFLVAIMALYVVQMSPHPAVNFLWNSYKLLVILFVPLVICTGWNDPLLAVFGAKQYLLFPVVGFAMFYGFQKSKMAQILSFFRAISLLLIPTAILAFVQLSLPHDNWLNMSVGGESLEGFSAGGQLRVTSSFSFVSQYCAFLNAQAFIVMIALYGWRKWNWLWKLAGLSLIAVLVFSCLITGSRGAVAGNTAICLAALALALMKFQVRAVLEIGLLLIFLYLMVLAVNHYSPETTAAYSARENGRLIGISPEIRARVVGSFFDLEQDPALQTYFGNGLGVMSNGTTTFSEYATIWRMRMWTESDFASTLFEGGYYLVIIWYGFRLIVMGVTTYRFLKNVSAESSFAASFIQAFLLVVGSVGTLGMQPPVAIWWWIGVGTSLVFWWRCVGPSEVDLDLEDELLTSSKRARGRSLYADALHSRPS